MSDRPPVAIKLMCAHIRTQKLISALD